MPILIYLLLAFILLIVVSGGYIFVIGCVRRKELPWLDEEEIKKTSYKKYYDIICHGDRFLKEHNAQKVTIKSYDGLLLSGLWVPAENPKGTILLAHGYRSTKLLDFSLALDFYHDYGMNLLLPDQRSHGDSQGKIITFGVKESRDMKSWIDFHNKTYGENPMILSGLSMGASTMLFLADKELPKNVKGIIADCGFSSPWEIIKSVFKRVIHLPAAPSLLAAELFAHVFGGFSFREMDTREILKNSKLPILMVHGAEDGFVPCQMSQLGFDACVGEKELLIVDGADHGVSFLVDQSRYTKAIQRFFNKHLEAKK